MKKNSKKRVKEEDVLQVEFLEDIYFKLPFPTKGIDLRGQIDPIKWGDPEMRKKYPFVKVCIDEYYEGRDRTIQKYKDEIKKYKKRYEDSLKPHPKLKYPPSPSYCKNQLDNAKKRLANFEHSLKMAKYHAEHNERADS